MSVHGETACIDENSVAAYLAGALSGQRVAQVQQHLDSCSKCRAVLAQVVTSTAGSQPAVGLGGLLTGVLVDGQLVGRYRVVRMIGAGAMGVVYLGHDPQLDRRVALKVLRAHRSGEQAEERLKREASAMAQLTHRNVCSVYDVCTDERDVCIVMEFLDGVHLSEHLKAAASDWRTTLAMLLEAGEGLAAAHGRGVLHRDFKPDNVLVAKDGRVCVTDFGLAGAARDPDSETIDEPPDAAAASQAWWPAGERNRLTRPGTVMGTPAYMAPEVHRGEPATARSDQFSFALASWECLHGDRPFTPAAVERLRRGERPAPRPTRGTPRKLRQVLLRAMDPEPARRYRDLPALLGAMRAAARRSRGLMAATVVMLVIAAAAAAVTWSVRAPPLRVAVAELEGESSSASLDTLGELLQASLERSGQLELVPRERLPVTPGRARELARAKGARLVIAPRGSSEGGRYHLRVEIIDVESGEVRFVVEESASKGELVGSVERLSDAVLRRLSQPLP